MKQITKALSFLLAAGLAAGTAVPVFADSAWATPETAEAPAVVQEETPAEQTPGDSETPPQEELEYEVVPGGEEGFRQELAARSEMAAQCSDSAVAVYDAQENSSYTQLRERMEAALAARQTDVDVRDLGITTTQIRGLSGDFSMMKGGYQLKNGFSYYRSGTLVTSLVLNYYTEAECKAMRQVITRIANRAAAGSTDLEKIMLIHNDIVARTRYDYDNEGGDDRYMAYGVLINGLAVCDGYTKAFGAVASEMGIRAIRVSSQQLNHAWDMVQADGSWYELDATWDDSAAFYDYGQYTYQYFMRSSAAFRSECEHDATDLAAFYDSFDVNMADAAVDTTYDSAFWANENYGSLIQLYDGDWYYTQKDKLVWRDDLWGSASTENATGQTVHDASLIGGRLFGTDGTMWTGKTRIDEYALDSATHTVQKVNTTAVTNSGVTPCDNKLYYAVSTSSKSWDVYQFDIGEPETPEVKSDVYDIEDDVLFGVAEKTTPDELLKNLNSTQPLTVQDTAANGNVATGTQICDQNGNVVLTVIIYGDVNGDGQITANDLVEMRRAILGLSQLEGVYCRAAAFISGNEKKPTSQDLSEMRRYQLKLIDKLG